MPTDLPADVMGALDAEQMADEIAVLVTITDTTLATPLRYTTAQHLLGTDPLQFGLVSAGETFVHALRSQALPDDAAGQAQATAIEIDNVVENAKPKISALSDAARVALALVLISQPDTRFFTVTGLRVINRTYSMETVTIEVSRHANRSGAADALEPLSSERQTRARAPGLFR